MDPQDTTLTEALKVAIRSFYSNECQYCGSRHAIHVEHIVAKFKNGPDTLGNVTLSCERCNLKKGVLDLDPMFLAIAHARALHSAPRILAMMRPARMPIVKQPRAPVIKIAKVINVVKPPKVVPSMSAHPIKILPRRISQGFWDLVSLEEIISSIPEQGSKEGGIDFYTQSGRLSLICTRDDNREFNGPPFGPAGRALMAYAGQRAMDGFGYLDLDNDLDLWLHQINQVTPLSREDVMDQIPRMLFSMTLFPKSGVERYGNILIGRVNSVDQPGTIGIDLEFYRSISGSYPDADQGVVFEPMHMMRLLSEDGAEQAQRP